MKRRDFLKRTVPATVLPFTLGGFSVKAYGGSRSLNRLLGVDTDRVLVLIQLSGGNDGLNTVIPLDQYELYRNARSNIAIAEASALKLSNATGLHPEMTGMHTMFTNGTLRVVQSVGYPTPDYSHFRSTDIWLTGADYDQVIETGWMGRYLDQEFPGYPDAYPNPAMPDPLAIQIGSALSTGLEGPTANMGMAFTDPNSFYNIVDPSDPTTPNGRAGFEIDYIRSVGRQLEKFADPVKAAAGRATNKSTLYPAARQNALADQLKIVSTLIAGGLKTRIYIVSMGGFDTHANQISGGNGTPVPHGTLLNQLSTAVSAFQDDLRLLNVADRVVGMTFSEFGRRMQSNGSGGTDHGAAAPLFAFGTNVIPGILGPNPLIPSSVTSEDNVPMLYDFRSIYSSILTDWFLAPPSEVESVLFRPYDVLPIIKGTSSDVRDDGRAGSGLGLAVSPNPARESIRIRFTSRGGEPLVALFDGTGREIRRVIDRGVGYGEKEITVEITDLPAGTYYCRAQEGGVQQVESFTVVR